MFNKILFNDKAHSILSQLLDDTEDWLVHHKLAEPRQANDRLCRDYIITCSDIIWGSTFFVKSDERIGTEIFIERLRGAKTKLRSRRNARVCIDQLLQFPQVYFPNYLVILRVTYLDVLSKLNDEMLIQLSEIIKLAAANLPGVRSDVRRELRRRGMDCEREIVHDDTLEGKLARFSADIMPMVLDTADDADD